MDAGLDNIDGSGIADAIRSFNILDKNLAALRRYVTNLEVLIGALDVETIRRFRADESDAMKVLSERLRRFSLHHGDFAQLILDLEAKIRFLNSRIDRSKTHD